jgi:ABC-type transport system involved in cytochrome c biogenesis permease subunit
MSGSTIMPDHHDVQPTVPAWMIFVLLVIALSWSWIGAVRSVRSRPAGWQAWSTVAAYDEGRVKPLDTVAREMLCALTHRESWSDPATGAAIEAVPLCLSMVLDWRGWDPRAPATGPARRRPAGTYFGAHQPDKWDHAPLLRVECPELRCALALSDDRAAISVYDLVRTTVTDPRTHERRPFLTWADELGRQDQEHRSELERQAMTLAARCRTYQAHRMGESLRVIPCRRGAARPWMSIAQLAQTAFDDRTDPSGSLRQAQIRWRSLQSSHAQGSPQDFQTASAAWLDCLNLLASESEVPGAAASAYAEVLYNRAAPLRGALVSFSLAGFSLLLHLVSGRPTFLAGGRAGIALGLVILLGVFAWRTVISGHVPVASTYECVLFVALCVMLLGIKFEAVRRDAHVLTIATGVTVATLLLAVMCTPPLDAGVRPLSPELRSQGWLAVHVMTIAASGAAFLLALGIANVLLGYHLAGAKDHPTLGNLASCSQRAVQLGVLLMVMGTTSGSVWADHVWGRGWGWDPKEVWTLVALLGYVGLLSARQSAWIGQFGWAFLSAACFTLLGMAWYGVNCVLRTGLHHYGFGDGGGYLVVGGLILQIGWMGAASLRHLVECHDQRECARLGTAPPDGSSTRNLTAVCQ